MRRIGEAHPHSLGQHRLSFTGFASQYIRHLRRTALKGLLLPLRKAPGNVGVDVRTKRGRCRKSKRLRACSRAGGSRRDRTLRKMTRRFPRPSGSKAVLHCGNKFESTARATSGMRQYFADPQASTHPSSSSFSEQPRGALPETGPALPRPIPIRPTSGLPNNGTPPQIRRTVRQCRRGRGQFFSGRWLNDSLSSVETLFAPTQLEVRFLNTQFQPLSMPLQIGECAGGKADRGK